MTFSGAHFAAAGFSELQGDTTQTQPIVVNGSNVNLSGLSFAGWGGANQTITINGTAGSDTLTGSTEIDIINGGQLNDTITGGGKRDTLNGGPGLDRFIFAVDGDAVGDAVDGGLGDDTVRVTASMGFGFTTFTSIERIEAFATNATFLSTHFGAGLANALAVVGDAQANEIRVNLSAGQHDFDASAWTFKSWDAADHVTFDGTNTADTMTGSILSDIFDGDGGADILDGDDGDDIFRFDNGEVAPSLSVTGGNGVDELRIGADGFSFDLTSLVGIEKLNFEGASAAIFDTFGIGGGKITQIDGSTGANRIIVNIDPIVGSNAPIDLSALTFTDWTDGTDTIEINGLSGSNTLTGTSRNDIIDGKVGVDTMNGLGGDDVYVADNGGDIVNEAVGGGNDEVRTSANYTLGAGQEIEVLAIKDAASNGAFDLIGNAFGQTLSGNAGANILDGKGGADTMNGLGGADLYFIDNALDIVNETIGGGEDNVETSVTYTLKADQEIERFFATTGAAAIDLTGNALAQIIIGNSGANILKGLAGADSLNGGNGVDTADYSEKTQAVVVFLNGSTNATVTIGGAAEDIVREIENLNGGSAGDSLVGEGSVNVLNGNGGRISCSRTVLIPTER